VVIFISTDIVNAKRTYLLIDQSSRVLLYQGFVKVNRALSYFSEICDKHMLYLEDIITWEELCDVLSDLQKEHEDLIKEDDTVLHGSVLAFMRDGGFDGGSTINRYR